VNRNPIARYFQFNEVGTTFGRETVGGITTFLAMAYILFVNPTVLGATHMDTQALFTATALSAAFGTLLMGILAKYPVAVAPGMGLNAFFTYTVVIGMGIPWQTAIAGVFVAGVIFVIISILKIREIIINAIPENLKRATAAGIGLFIAFIGLENSQIVVKNSETLVQIGSLHSPGVLLTIFGLIVTVIFLVRGIQGGVFYGMVLTAVVGVIMALMGITDKANPVFIPDSLVSSIPSLDPIFGVAITHLGDINTWNLVVVVLTFLFVGFFDTAGTLMAIANQAKILKDNKLPRAGRALFADSFSIVVGSILGTSPTTAYIESSAGVASGGRTGFSAVVTAIMFLLAMFFSPLLGVVTADVTAPALIVVGVLMASSLKDIEWDKLEIAIPAFLTIVMMPFTYSITTGIALGFVVYPITMIVRGRIKELHPVMYVLFFIFLIFLPILAK
jgi:adenine/guanine/hypoxanthine permease